MAERHKELIGAALRRWRNQRDLTQADVADAIGGSPSTVAHWESGRRQPSLDDLFGDPGTDSEEFRKGVRWARRQMEEALEEVPDDF